MDTSLHPLHKTKTHSFNTLNTELNPMCHLLALLGAHPILHVSRIRVNNLCIPPPHHIHNSKITSGEYNFDHFQLSHLRKFHWFLQPLPTKSDHRYMTDRKFVLSVKYSTPVDVKRDTIFSPNTRR